MYHVLASSQHSSLYVVIWEKSPAMLNANRCHTDSGVLAEIAGSLQTGQWSAKLKHCLDTEAAAAHENKSLSSHLTLLSSCNTALNLHKDTGFEVALQFIAKACLIHQQSTLELNKSQADRQQAASPMSPMQTSASNFSSTTMSPAEAQSLSNALIHDLSEHVCHLQLALDAWAAAQAGAQVSFPKFKELVAILKAMQEKKSAWHSIVFVKERQSVHAITQLLGKMSDLANISFFAFTGRAKNSKQSMHPGQVSGQKTNGMKLSQQKNALLQFREASGMAVLVATAAAEEGLDIINCELVVCYTAVDTGKEMVQRRGRARMAGSQFISIVEEHDQSKLRSAQLAECNAKLALMDLTM